MRRANAAFTAEGWSNIGPGGAYVYANKGIHSAYIMCNTAPENTIWVNIVVASNASDGTIPGAERVKLQGRMERSASDDNYIDWAKQANQIEGRQIGSRYTFTCRGGGSTGGRLWGSDLYTDDSSICLAALHSGLISTSGGTITIEIRAGAQSYVGSTRYGVTSNAYGGWGGSFVFVR